MTGVMKQTEQAFFLLSVMTGLRLFAVAENNRFRIRYLKKETKINVDK